MLRSRKQLLEGEDQMLRGAVQCAGLVLESCGRIQTWFVRNILKTEPITSHGSPLTSMTVRSVEETDLSDKMYDNLLGAHNPHGVIALNLLSANFAF